jgi:hypothetical protein
VDLFQAARLSLGLIGVATRIEIDVLPAYYLEEMVESHPIDAVEERWDELVANNRHAEFWVFPNAEMAIVKTLTPAPGEGALKLQSDMDDRAFRVICDLCATLPFLTPSLQKMIVGPNVRQRRVGPAYQIFRSDGEVRGDGIRDAAKRRLAGAARSDGVDQKTQSTGDVSVRVSHHRPGRHLAFADACGPLPLDLGAPIREDALAPVLRRHRTDFPRRWRASALG